MDISCRIVSTLAAVLLLGACEPSGTQLLPSRIKASMDPAEACNRQASVEYLPAGARIRMPDTALFVIGRTDVTNCGRFVLASVVEAMLDPRIMQVTIEPGADINAEPDAFFPRARTNSIKALLSNAGYTSGQPPVLVLPFPTPSPGVWGVVLTIVN